MGCYACDLPQAYRAHLWQRFSEYCDNREVQDLLVRWKHACDLHRTEAMREFWDKSEGISPVAYRTQEFLVTKELYGKDLHIALRLHEAEQGQCWTNRFDRQRVNNALMMATMLFRSLCRQLNTLCEALEERLVLRETYSRHAGYAIEMGQMKQICRIVHRLNRDARVMYGIVRYLYGRDRAE